jgi:tripeptide aminopeptidase
MMHVDRERLIRTFLDLVKIPSPSWKEKGIIDYVTGVLEECRVPFTLYPCGESANLLARMEGTRPGAPVLFSCHMDTVVPCERVNPVVKKDRISSDGTTVLGGDDKAAVAAFLEAIRALTEQGLPHGPIEFLFSCAEEIGLHGIKCFDLTQLRAKRGFVFDSGGEIGTIIIQAPSQVTMEIFIKGKAAHAGMEPEKGVSAIRVLSEVLSSIPHGRIDRHTTVNAGIISGGKATNIVAEDAYCKLEARSHSRASLAAIERRIRKTAAGIARRHGAAARVKRSLEYTGFSIKKDSPVVRTAVSAAKEINAVPRYESSGGGSDTNVLNRGGIRAVNLSVGMRNVHTTREYILISDLEKAARLVLALAATA